MILKRSWRWPSVFAAAVVCAGLGLAVTLGGPIAELWSRAGEAAARSPRNARWAVRIERSGVPNLFRVSADLYRGAQPTPEGFRQLRALGIKTVVNLRAFHSDDGQLDPGTAHEWINFKTWRPDDEDARRFLQIVTDKARLPVFVHCKRGSDRTGMMVAIYRVCVQGWSKADAIAEMKHGGFGFNPLWQHLVRHVERLDVERMLRAASLPAQGSNVTPGP